MTDWMPELADDDLDVLMEALEAWEIHDAGGAALTDCFSCGAPIRGMPIRVPVLAALLLPIALPITASASGWNAHV